jgi:hypothetical protein
MLELYLLISGDQTNVFVTKFQIFITSSKKFQIECLIISFIAFSKVISLVPIEVDFTFEIVKKLKLNRQFSKRF